MTLFDFTVKGQDGQDVPLSQYKGQVVMVVNTATRCGFTPQYEGLQKLHDAYHDKGFEILDFPCNQFGNQAPESTGEIHEFCTLNYGTTFPQFDKIDVNGENASELYTWLKAQKKGVLGSNVKWNFTKFLVDRDGAVVARYGPEKKPEAIEADIKKLLEKV